MPENISPQELLSRFQNNEPIRIIDVRTPAEFGNLHVRNAENIPLDLPRHSVAGFEPWQRRIPVLHLPVRWSQQKSL